MTHLHPTMYLSISWINGGWYIIREGSCLFGLQVYSRRFKTKEEAQSALDKLRETSKS